MYCVSNSRMCLKNQLIELMSLAGFPSIFLNNISYHPQQITSWLVTTGQKLQFGSRVLPGVTGAIAREPWMEGLLPWMHALVEPTTHDSGP